jgi:hypothetical protein
MAGNNYRRFENAQLAWRSSQNRPGRDRPASDMASPNAAHHDR